MTFGKNVSLAEYWKKVRGIQLELTADLPDYPPPVFTVIETGGTALCEVDSETAAKLFYVGSHRIATGEELAAWKKTQDATRAVTAQAERDRKQQTTMAMDPILSAALAQVLASGNKKQETKEIK